MSSPTAACHILVGCIAFGHVLIGLGIGWGIGPVAYDPEQMLLRGQPAKLQPGLEMLFPKLIGCVYASFGVGLFYSLLIERTTSSIRTALVPCLFYHLGGALDALLGGVTAGAINADKMNPNEPIIGHSFFMTLATVAIILSGASTKNDRKANKEE